MWSDQVAVMRNRPCPNIFLRMAAAPMFYLHTFSSSVWWVCLFATAYRATRTYRYHIHRESHAVLLRSVESLMAIRKLTITSLRMWNVLCVLVLIVTGHFSCRSSIWDTDVHVMMKKKNWTIDIADQFKIANKSCQQSSVIISGVCDPCKKYPFGYPLSEKYVNMTFFCGERISLYIILLYRFYFVVSTTTQHIFGQKLLQNTWYVWMADSQWPN